MINKILSKFNLKIEKVTEIERMKAESEAQRAAILELNKWLNEIVRRPDSGESSKIRFNILRRNIS